MIHPPFPSILELYLARDPNPECDGIRVEPFGRSQSNEHGILMNKVGDPPKASKSQVTKRRGDEVVPSVS